MACRVIGHMLSLRRLNYQWTENGQLESFLFGSGTALTLVLLFLRESNQLG